MKLFTIVPQQSKYIVERLGKYHKTLEPGFHFLIPFIDIIEYQMSLKEQIIHVGNQRAITKDNVALTIDGVVFFTIEDEKKASYNVANYSDGKIYETNDSSEIARHDINEIRTGKDRAEQDLPDEKGAEHKNIGDA